MRGQIAKESPTFIRRSDMQREHKNGDKSDPPGRKVEFDQRKGKRLVSDVFPLCSRRIQKQNPEFAFLGIRRAPLPASPNGMELLRLRDKTPSGGGGGGGGGGGRDYLPPSTATRISEAIKKIRERERICLAIRLSSSSYFFPLLLFTPACVLRGNPVS